MRQPYPRRQIVRHRQDIPQSVDLEFVEQLVHSGFQECFELVHTVLNLGACFGKIDVPIAVRVRNGDICGWLVGKSEGLRSGREEAILDRLDGTVYDGIDCVDDIVNE